MTTLRTTISTMIMVLFAWPMAASAHHSHNNLNTKNVVTLFGVVDSFSWRSPHVFFKVNVTKDSGEAVQYVVASNNPAAMIRLGWTKETLKKGDKIIWNGAHDKNIDRPYTGLKWVEKNDGTRFYSSAVGLNEYLEETGTKAPEGYVGTKAVKPATEIASGTWSRISPEGGRFKAIRKPATGWPLTSKATDEVARFHENENPMVQCIYGGPPRGMLAPLSFQLAKHDNNTITIHRDLWPEPRVVHMDKNHKAKDASSWGHSIGWYEGNELVVETTDFVAEKWGMYTGISSSAQKHLIERYSLSEGGLRLNVKISITDPEYLTETMTITHQWGKAPDRDLVTAPCTLDTAWLYLPDGYKAE